MDFIREKPTYRERTDQLQKITNKISVIDLHQTYNARCRLLLKGLTVVLHLVVLLHRVQVELREKTKEDSGAEPTAKRVGDDKGKQKKCCVVS